MISKLMAMQEAYIVAGYRTAVGKSKRGGFRFTRPDDLAIDVIKALLDSVPQLDKARVDDVFPRPSKDCK
jgi:acetyl-CoA acyltransferase